MYITMFSYLISLIYY